MKSPPLLFALAAAFLCAQSSSASSIAPRPLVRIDHPLTESFHILPRQHTYDPRTRRRSIPSTEGRLLHTDSIRLSVRAFDETFHLHLKPNTDLIHPSARINYYDHDGRITHTEPLLASDYKIFHGDVVSDDRTYQRLREDFAGGLASPAPELGWARIIVHDEADGVQPIYEGVFTVRGQRYHIQTQTNYLRNRHPVDPSLVDPDHPLVIFRDSDILSDDDHSTARSCAHDKLRYNTDDALNPVLAYGTALRSSSRSPWYDPRLPSTSLTDPLALDARHVKRQNDMGGGNVTSNFIDRIGSHEGCKTTQSFIYMGVAADCTYVSHYGGTENATTQILNNWNSASSLYKSTFNVSMGIVELAVQQPTCPTTADSATPWNIGCSDTVTLNDRLSLFSQWRGAKGAADGAGLWHLMSGCPTGTEVGVAWLGQLCETRASGSPGEIVSGTGVSTATRTEWQVVAHEIGHNFGAIHDCASGCTLTGPCCPASTSQCDSPTAFIMDAVSNVGENTFSPCTVGNICASMETMNTTCLLPADNSVQVISKQMCGNGIVEAGEDCDPGKGNTSPCCDSTTCKFVAGAVCDPKSSDCCTNSCQFAPSTQVCRPAVDPTCDFQETCTGSSSACPADKTASDGTSCGGNGLACASGMCTSPDQQCKTVGSSLGLTKACPASNDKSCQVSCQDPQNSQQCIVLQATLVDGSPCGYGGRCENNVCKSGSVGDTIKAWYRQNLQISIPVTIVVGIVVLLILWRIGAACLGCCRRSRARKAGMAPSAVYRGASGSNAGRQRLQSWPENNIPPPGASDEYGYPPMRDAPQTSTRGYVSPGTVYPPSYAVDEHHVDTRVDNAAPARNNWDDDHRFERGVEQGGGYNQPAVGGYGDPFRDRGDEWVDDRAWNGNGYGYGHGR